jgi:hypothetical protein
VTKSPRRAGRSERRVFIIVLGRSCHPLLLARCQLEALIR